MNEAVPPSTQTTKPRTSSHAGMQMESPFHLLLSLHNQSGSCRHADRVGPRRPEREGGRGLRRRLVRSFICLSEGIMCVIAWCKNGARPFVHSFVLFHAGVVLNACFLVCLEGGKGDWCLSAKQDDGRWGLVCGFCPSEYTHSRNQINHSINDHTLGGTHRPPNHHPPTTTVTHKSGRSAGLNQVFSHALHPNATQQRALRHLGPANRLRPHPLRGPDASGRAGEP